MESYLNFLRFSVNNMKKDELFSKVGTYNNSVYSLYDNKFRIAFDRVNLGIIKERVDIFSIGFPLDEVSIYNLSGGSTDLSGKDIKLSISDGIVSVNKTKSSVILCRFFYDKDVVEYYCGKSSKKITLKEYKLYEMDIYRDIQKIIPDIDEFPFKRFITARMGGDVFI